MNVRRSVVLAAAALVAVAGLVTCLVLLVAAERRPGAQIDAFARAGLGCTTTVRVDAPGEYYVYAELGGEPVERSGCEPTAAPGTRFGVVVTGVDTVEDERSVVYSRGVVSASSVQRFVAEAGDEVTVTAVGSDPGVVVAVGPDPEAGVATRRVLAALFAGVGLVLAGVVVVVASGRGRGSPSEPPPGNVPASTGPIDPLLWGPPDPGDRRG